jgi:O-antigen/teichoic acid export membrane protein
MNPARLKRMISTTRQAGWMLRLHSHGERRSLWTMLVKGTVGSVALKICSIGLSFVTGLLLARMLGAEGYGVYVYATSWVSMLGVLATVGMDNMLVRNVTAYKTRSEWGLMKGLLRRANQIALATSLALSLLAASLSWALGGLLEAEALSTFWIALVLLPLVTLTALRQATMRGLYRVVLGQLPDSLLRPLLLVVLVGGAYLLFEENLSASGAMAMSVVAAGIAFLVGTLMLYRSLPRAAKEAPPVYRTRDWVWGALPLLFVGGMQVINTRIGVLMLGSLEGAEAAGVYAVAVWGADLIAIILVAGNMVLGPTFANLYAAGEVGRLQRLTTRSARVIVLCSLPITLVLVVFGHWFMLLFGQEFVEGRTGLAILSIGQLVNTAFGSVGVLLIMTGHGRDAAAGIGISVLLNLSLSAVLIPIYGLEGAAVAAATSLVVWNTLLAIRVHRRLRIYPAAFGRIGPWR